MSAFRNTFYLSPLSLGLALILAYLGPADWLRTAASGGAPTFQVAAGSPLYAQSAVARALPDPYYPQQPPGGLKLNYYYDRSGRWVKFSDWIPFQQKKWAPMHLEDFYQLYGLPHHYKTGEVKESIYFLVQALTHRFRHPRNALCKIENEQQYHKYRLLMFMQINLVIMRMFLRLGSLYDKRHLYFHDLDFADDLEISFLVARTYYTAARLYWKQAVNYAEQANEYRFELDLPTIESHRFNIVQGKLNFDRIIDRHLYRVEAKLETTTAFLDEEGRPRPVKNAMQKDLESMYDESFTPAPLGPPVLDPEWKDTPLFDDVNRGPMR
ncbi:MAG: hypothetical protein RIF32_23885 [Leptospirales bacterium]|jgi:hypothetical protein